MCKKLMIVYIFMILLMSSRDILAQENTFSSLLLFEDWSVSILGAQTDNYDEYTSTQKNVAVNLKPLLAYIIKNVDVHYLSSEEKQRAQKLQKEDGIRALSSQIESAQNKVDNEILNTDDGTAWQKRDKSNKEIRKLQRKLSKLQKIDPKDLNIEGTLRVNFIEDSSQNVISNLVDFRELSIQKKSHVLIYYKLFQLEDYVIVDLFEYNVLTNSSRRVMKTIVEPNNIERIVQSLSLNVTNMIKGTSTAQLNVNVYTANSEILYDAKILVDGEEVSFGKVEINTIVSGTHVIDIIYRDVQQQAIIVLNSGELLNKDFFVNTTSDDVVLVRSNPSNAKLYIDAEWKGNTPVTVARPLLVANGELVLAGYEQSRFTLSQESPKILDMVLIPTNEIPLKERFDQDRRKFYNAFAMFAVSLAIPVVLNGFFVNESNALNAGASGLSASELSQSNVRKNAYYYSYLSSIGVSTGLGIFAMLRLRQYLKTASEYQER